MEPYHPSHLVPAEVPRKWQAAAAARQFATFDSIKPLVAEWKPWPMLVHSKSIPPGPARVLSE